MIRSIAVAAFLACLATPAFAIPYSYECTIDQPNSAQRLRMELTFESSRSVKGCIRGAEGYECSREFTPFEATLGPDSILAASFTMTAGNLPATIRYNMKARALVLTTNITVLARDCKAVDDPGGPPKLWEIADRDYKLAQAEGMPDTNIINLGPTVVRIGSTGIMEIAASTGGRVAHSGDASTSTDWVCLHVDGDTFDTRLWLTSGEMDGDRVGGISTALLPAAAAADRDCAGIKPEQAAIRLPGDLTLGATEAALRKRLGKTSYDKAGTLAFMRTFDLGIPPSRGGPCQRSLSTWARIQDGVVSGLSFGRGEAC